LNFERCFVLNLYRKLAMLREIVIRCPADSSMSIISLRVNNFSTVIKVIRAERKSLNGKAAGKIKK
jgi:hypothetical protein